MYRYGIINLNECYTEEIIDFINLNEHYYCVIYLHELSNSCVLFNLGVDRRFIVQ